MEYKINKNKEVYNIDFDGTLSTGEYSDDPGRNEIVIKKVTELFFNGHVIIVWTARQWNFAPMLVAWLIKHSVPFHGIMMGKGGSDHYLDDRALNFDEFVGTDKKEAPVEPAMSKFVIEKKGHDGKFRLHRRYNDKTCAVEMLFKFNKNSDKYRLVNHLGEEI